MPTKAKAAKAPKGKGISVVSVAPCLTFPSGAEEAIHFYVSVFKNSRVKKLVRMEEEGPIPKGALLHASFTLNGAEFTAFDGGPVFAFSPAFSIVATCKTQQEIDDVWAKLSDGGEAGPCGWLTDKFGVSWQVVPEALGQMLANPKKGNAAAVMEALLKMGKLDLAALKQAYKQR